jgi:hypothetical protein
MELRDAVRCGDVEAVEYEGQHDTVVRVADGRLVHISVHERGAEGSATRRGEHRGQLVDRDDVRAGGNESLRHLAGAATQLQGTVAGSNVERVHERLSEASAPPDVRKIAALTAS